MDFSTQTPNCSQTLFSKSAPSSQVRLYFSLNLACFFVLSLEIPITIQFNFSNENIQILPATFIRAPKIKRLLSEESMVLGTLNDDPVAFISGNKLCLTFHPELDQIDIFHRILFDPTSEVYYKKIGQKHFA